MGRKTNISKKVEIPENGLVRISWGMGFMAAGLLLFLSLVSFHRADLVGLPMLDGFSEGGEKGPNHNLVGVVGTILGFIQLQFLGAAAWMLPLGMIWLGVRRAFMKGEFGWMTWTGFVVLLLSASALAGVTGWWDIWAANNGIGGKSGGVIGNFLGLKIFKNLLSVAGSVIALGLIYLASLILFLGLHPIGFAKALWEEFQNFREGRAKAQPAPAAAGASRPKKNPIAEPKKSSKAEPQEQLEAIATTFEVEETTGQGRLPLREVPEPQIIDSSQKRAPAPEAGARAFERRKPEHVALSTEGFDDYELPGFDLLDFDESEGPTESNYAELFETQQTIVETLSAFGVEVTAGDITRGPTITRYEVYPSIGLRVNRITALESDLARATKAERINILAPIPGKDTVGIEIANSQRVAVPLRELLQDPEFRSSKKKIPLALGKDVYGNAVIGDLAAMPHLLVAGATGSGKSVCINSIITSILYKFGPDELRFIMVDPKVVEMQMYNRLPHLVVPVVTDPRRVVGALKWTVNEMERRYKIFAKMGVRNFDSFNNRVRPEVQEATDDLEIVQQEPKTEEEITFSEEELESIARALEEGELGPNSYSEDEEDEDEEVDDVIPDRFPYIVVIIDELADLMQTAPADIESAIARIAQKARAAGIHLIVATQTPRADVVTGIIKANIPSRIAFQVSSALDSRVILDSKGAEKLVGKGDMLFLPPGSAKLERSQGAFVSDEEVEHIVNFCSNQSEQRFEQSIQDTINSGGGEEGSDEVSDEDEEIVQRCIDVIMTDNKASTSLLQRRLRLGYTKAARMMDILEQRGYIGPADGAKPREIKRRV